MRDEQREGTGTLTRCRDFIESHADEDIGIQQIAEAAHVTPRAVQLSFRTHLDTTPTAYLRRVRLERARRDLQEARPDQGVTVTGIAAKWRFANASRFAAYYRAAFGTSPSSSLARAARRGRGSGSGGRGPEALTQQRAAPPSR